MPSATEPFRSTWSPSTATLTLYECYELCIGIIDVFIIIL